MRTIIFVFCLVHFGNGQTHVLTNSVNNNGHNGDVVKKCSAFNEYCQTNLDCCSRNCLSFSYKCIRERVAQPELPSNTVQQPEIPFVGQPAGNANSVQDLVDRFGSDGESNAPTPGSFPQNSQVGPTFPPPSSSVSVNGGGSRPTHHQQPPANGNRPCLRSGGNCLRSHQCCSGQCSRITNKCIVGDEQSQFLSHPSISCSAIIGDTCSRQEDCCAPLHCHDFLRHCVT